MKTNTSKSKRKIKARSATGRMLQTARFERILSLSIDVVKRFTKTEYAIYAQRLANYGNKRIKEIQKTGYDSYAVNQVIKHGGKFKIDFNSGINDIQKEVNRINSFLRQKSSSIEGLKAISKKAQNTLSNKLNKKVIFTPQQEKTFYNILNDFRTNLPDSYFYENYKEIIEYVNDIISSDVSTDVMLRIASVMSKSMYHNYQSSNNYGMTETEIEFWEDFDRMLEEREKQLNNGIVSRNERPKLYNEETYAEVLNNEVIGSDEHIKEEDRFWRSYYEDTDL